MKIFIVLSSFAFFQNLLLAQQVIPLSERVNIKALSQSSNNQLYTFNIDIYRQQNKVKIVYSVLDSFTAKKMYRIFFHHMFHNMQTEHSSRRRSLSIDSIAMRKKLYQKDSIEFNPNDNSKEYTALIDSCFLQNSHQFDSKMSSDIIHVSGVPYKFTFEENQKIIKVLHIISPTWFDYSFLAHLISETFNLYKQKNNSLLNEANTDNWYPISDK